MNHSTNTTDSYQVKSLQKNNIPAGASGGFDPYSSSDEDAIKLKMKGPVPPPKANQNPWSILPGVGVELKATLGAKGFEVGVNDNKEVSASYLGIGTTFAPQDRFVDYGFISGTTQPILTQYEVTHWVPIYSYGPVIDSILKANPTLPRPVLPGDTIGFEKITDIYTRNFESAGFSYGLGGMELQSTQLWKNNKLMDWEYRFNPSLKAERKGIGVEFKLQNKWNDVY